MPPTYEMKREQRIREAKEREKNRSGEQQRENTTEPTTDEAVIETQENEGHEDKNQDFESEEEFDGEGSVQHEEEEIPEIPAIVPFLPPRPSTTG